MDVIDLTPLYIQAQGGDLRDYHAAYPELFQHYYRFWADGEGPAPFPREVVRERAALLRARLPGVQKALVRRGFPEPMTLVLFVGRGTTNGHAFWDSARRAFVVWLPVEAYTTALQADLFVAHEWLHALHYTRHPELYFHDERAKNRVGRQLLTEGVATWGTLQVMGVDEIEALWADYVSPEFAAGWYRQCRLREREMARRLLAEWQGSRETNDWFAMWDEHDVTRYRGGYYMGLQVMERLHREHGLDLSALLNLAPRTLERWARAALEAMAGEDPT